MRLRAWGLAVVFCALFFFAASAQEEDPAARRALLVGCDAFITHENTAPG